jgi:photosystem II stability/assembly factor-like uncharacterized protein
MAVWSLAIDRTNPQHMFAGTGAPQRAAMFRSLDGGNSWARLNVELPEFCRGVNRPRILSICIDAEDGRDVWFGVEESGAWRSLDCGTNWRRVDVDGSGISSSDIHAIAALPATPRGPKTHLILTVNSVYTSLDNGTTWSGASSRARFDNMYYTRTLEALPGDPDTLLIAIGDGTPGTRSRLYRSEDRGRTWVPSVLHSAPNSTFWALAAHSSDPSRLFAGTKYGHLFRSRDGGVTWFKDWREFSEITSIAWTPFAAPVTAHPQSID